MMRPNMLYIEEDIATHATVKNICQRYPHIPQVTIQRYGEIFNRKAQNFRLQKKQPALILARKKGNAILPAPTGYSIGAQHNYYFSHLLNCPYDCRYCFLQGMYRSAHHLLFVNYEYFAEQIKQRCLQHHNESVHFFSGYDGDSLALEPLTQFTRFFLPVFAQYPKALLELRTKSTQIRSLLKQPALPNTVVAWSFTPDPMAQSLEHLVPTVEKRIHAMQQVAAHGWQVGIRIDPMIWHPDFKKLYTELFSSLFVLDEERLHSVSIGSFRLPKAHFQQMYRLYPQEKLFALATPGENGMMGFDPGLEKEMMTWCQAEILKYIPAEKIFLQH